MGLYYIPYILSHGMLLAKIVHFPPPVLFLGAEQCFWVVRTRHGAVERKHASWFYWFVFLNSDHGDEQRLDAKTRQRVIFLKSLNIRPLKTGFQHFSICGCLFFFLFFFLLKIAFGNASSPRLVSGLRSVLWGRSWVPVSSYIPYVGWTWSCAHSWELLPMEIIQ